MNPRCTGAESSQPRDFRICHLRWTAFAGLCLLVFFSNASYAQPIPDIPQIPAFLPMSHAVPRTQPMPIDGTWTISSIGKRIRIEAGRAFAVDPWVHMFVLKVQPGMVVIKDIQPTGPGTYGGNDLPLMGKFESRVSPDGAMDVTVAGMLGPVRYRLTPITLDNPAWHQQEMQRAGIITAPQPGQAPGAALPAYTIAPPGAGGAPMAQPAPGPTAPPVEVGGGWGCIDEEGCEEDL